MKIYVNGQQKSFESKEICLTSLIEKLALSEKKFAIEYNGEIIYLEVQCECNSH